METSPASGPIDATVLESKIIDVLRTCYDPEIPVDIHELGLVYEIAVDAQQVLHVTMTLTSPACPVAGSLPPQVQEKLKAQLEGPQGVEVHVVWDPPWELDMMSEAAKLQLGML